jgi:4,5-DOPA dioxygenase extradiol
MDRRSFLTLLAGGVVMTKTELSLSSSQSMPVLFLGHGSPMNALANNSYSKTLNALGKSLPRPKAILMVSAHWMTEGTWVTHMQPPKTIHDFYGFPKELFDVKYPAPGSPQLAEEIHKKIKDPKIQLDDKDWGLDHGAWSVLKHLYPLADIPVVQLSLDLKRSPEYHFELGEKLRFLREEKVLIIGSGNIVHHLGRLNWNENAPAHSWAVEFDQWVKEKLEKKDFTALRDDVLKTESGRLSVPTPEHYYPLLYILGAARREEKIKFEFEEIQNASISMRSFRFG